MAVTSSVPGQRPQQLIDWINDTIKCALITSMANYNQDTTVFWGTGAGTLQASEVPNGLGYTTGGNTVGSKSVAYDATTNRNQFRGTVPVWTSVGAGFSPVGAVYYKDTGNAATSPVVAVVDFGGAQPATNGGLLTVTPDATQGIYYAAPA